ncbi:MAG TPA: hypothetical protein VFS43_12550 [Polyangiaceae bacterium]|nr:hypothetical protein [Polyangiaceae bacterium]
MYFVERRVGRLIEARIWSLGSAAEVDAYARDLAAAVTLTPRGVRPVLCADHRPVVIYNQAVADRLAKLLSAMNHRLERAALLVAPTNATFAMQLGRIVREANNPARRLFDDAFEAAVFLRGELDEPERARLGLFLSGFEGDEGGEGPSTPRSARVPTGGAGPSSPRFARVAGGQGR